MKDTKQRLWLVTIPLCSVGILLNALLLMFALRHRVASRSATALVRSQAVLDLLVLSTNIVFVQLELVPQPRTSDTLHVGWYIYCILYSAMLFWFLVDCSIYNTLAFSIERCLCICCNFWWRRHKRAMVKLFYSFIVLSSFVAYVPLNLLSVWPQLVPTAGATNTSDSSVEVTIVCDSRGRVPDVLLKGLSASFNVLTVLAPTVCMLICYAVIIFHLRRSATMSALSNRSEAASKRFTVIVGLTVVAFMICNLPGTVIYNAWVLGVEVSLSQLFQLFIFPFLSALNSLVNPLIYLAFHRQFTRFVLCRFGRSDRSAAASTEFSVSHRVVQENLRTADTYL